MSATVWAVILWAVATVFAVLAFAAWLQGRSESLRIDRNAEYTVAVVLLAIVGWLVGIGIWLVVK